MTPENQENARLVLKRQLQMANAREIILAGNFYNTRRNAIPKEIIETGRQAMLNAIDLSLAEAIKELVALNEPAND